jgi:hypothetical protein
MPAPARTGNPLGRAVLYGFGGCLGVGLAFFAVAVVIGAMASKGSSGRTTAGGAATSSAEISPEEFTAIQNGMSIQQVVDIVGGPGVVDSENSLAQGTQFATTTAMYSFSGSRPMSRAGIMIQNGVVIQKHQFGLLR